MGPAVFCGLLSVLVLAVVVGLVLVLLDALELEGLAAVGALDGAEVQNVLVDGDGVLAGGAGDFVEDGLLAVVLIVLVAAAAAAAAFVLVVLVILVVEVVDDVLNIGEVVADRLPLP